MSLPAFFSFTRRGFRWSLLAVLLLALGGRLVWVLSLPTSEESLATLPDQVEYVTLARSLTNSGTLAFFDDRFGQNVYAYRTPGYPALVAVCSGIQITRVVQAILDASTVVAAALLGLSVLPASRARLGALLCGIAVAVNPLMVYFSGMLLSETLFTAQLTWGALLLIVGGRGGRLRLDEIDRDGSDVDGEMGPPYGRFRGTMLWLAGGALLATAGLVRPSTAPLGIAMGLAATLATQPPRNSGRSAFKPFWPLPAGSTMLLLTAVALVPWAYRNKQIVGDWVFTSTNGGITLWDGFNPDATGASNQAVLRKMPQLRAMGELERSQYMQARAMDFIRENPRRAMELAVAKAGRTWSPMPLSADYGTWRNKIIAATYAIPLFLLTLVGIRRGKLGGWMTLFLLTPAVYFTLVHMASVGSIRYRVPVEPLLAVVAVAGLMSLRAERPSWRRAGESVVP